MVFTKDSYTNTINEYDMSLIEAHREEIASAINLLWTTYPNKTVSNFETAYGKATTSKLDIFQPGFFGP